MSTPPQDPYFFPPPHTEKPAPERPRRRSNGVRPSRMVIVIALAIVVVLLAVVIMMFSFFAGTIAPTSTLSSGDVSATQEAQTFATAQTHRQETREAANATGTAL